MLDILLRLFHRALSVVLGAQGLLILVDRTLPRRTADRVIDLPHIDVRPNLGPLGLKIAIEGAAIRVEGALKVTLLKENLRNTIVRQGTLPVHIERFLVLL